MGTVARVLALIEVLGVHPEGMPVIKLAQVMRLPPSSTHRLLSLLREQGYVLQDVNTKLYSLSLKMFRFAARLLDSLDLRRVSSTHMQRLAELTGLNPLLTVYDRSQQEAICVDTIGGGGQIKFFVGLGKVMPLHCAATGKAVAAFLPKAERERLFENRVLERFTKRTCTDRGRLREEWKRIRKQGYAVCDEEMEMGVAAVGAPVWDSSGQVIGSIGVLGVKQAFESRDGKRIPLLVVAASKEISRTLGGSETIQVEED